MRNHFAEPEFRGFAVRRCLLLAVVLIMAYPLFGSTQNSPSPMT